MADLLAAVEHRLEVDTHVRVARERLGGRAIIVLHQARGEISTPSLLLALGRCRRLEQADLVEGLGSGSGSGSGQGWVGEVDLVELKRLLLLHLGRRIVHGDIELWREPPHLGGG